MTKSTNPLMSEGIIFIREYGGTYIARFNGKTASCTAGPEFAAKAVAIKVMGNRPHYVEMCGNKTAWQVVSTDNAIGKVSEPKLCLHDQRILQDFKDFRIARAAVHIHQEDWHRMTKKTKRAMAKMCLLALKAAKEGTI